MKVLLLSTSSHTLYYTSSCCTSNKQYWVQRLILCCQSGLTVLYITGWREREEPRRPRPTLSVTGIFTLRAWLGFLGILSLHNYICLSEQCISPHCIALLSSPPFSIWSVGNSAGNRSLSGKSSSEKWQLSWSASKVTKVPKVSRGETGKSLCQIWRGLLVALAILHMRRWWMREAG